MIEDERRQKQSNLTIVDTDNSRLVTN